MERSLSTDMRKEREDLKEAAEQSLNVILDLSLDGIIRWVSESWTEVVGTTPDSVKGKQIADLLLSNRDVFVNALESMRNDDSKSRIVRFRMAMGPLSELWDPSNGQKNKKQMDEKSEPGAATVVEVETELHEREQEHQQFVNLEGQGIIVYDRSTGQDSHVCFLHVFHCTSR